MNPTHNVLEVPSLGQQWEKDWVQRAWEAVNTFDDLMAQSAHIDNESARGEILLWVGRSDVPGSPAERYFKVVEGLQTDPELLYTPTEAIPRPWLRIEMLESSVREFYDKVTEAINTYGALPGVGDVPPPPKPPPRALPTFILASIAVMGLALPAVYG